MLLSPMSLRLFAAAVMVVAPAAACVGPPAREIFLDARAAGLAEAAGRGDGKAVAALLADGASLAMRGDRDVTQLQWMLLSRNRKGFDILLDAGADPGQPGLDGDTVVHLAAAADDPAYLSALLARGAKPDIPNDRSGRTPLMAAMMAERDRQFDMLMKAGADPGRADAMGNTPLHVAAQINEPRHVLALLEAGAPPAARNRQGETFQRYLNMADPKQLDWGTRESIRAVYAWLIRHKVLIEIRIPGR